MFKQMIATIFRPTLSVETTMIGADWADSEIKRLQADLQQKRNEALAKLGSKWLLHPSHSRKNLGVPANSLGKKTV